MRDRHLTVASGRPCFFTVISLITSVLLTLIIWAWTADAIKKTRLVGMEMLGLGSSAFTATALIWSSCVVGFVISYFLEPPSATELQNVGRAVVAALLSLVS